MKNLLFLALILSNVIYFSSSKKYKTENDKIDINYGSSQKKENGVYNFSQANFDEENQNKKELIRKNSEYWKLFLPLFLITFIFSGIYVYSGVFRGERTSSIIEEHNQ